VWLTLPVRLAPLAKLIISISGIFGIISIISYLCPTLLIINCQLSIIMRVVITGMGIYSCIGTSLSEVRDSLYQGKSGIVFLPERKEYG